MRPGALGPQKASRDPFPHYWAGYRDEGIMGVLDRAEAGKASKTRWHVHQALGEGTPPWKQQIRGQSIMLPHARPGDRSLGLPGPHPG